MKFIKPDFEYEWEDALRYREIENMDKDEWLKLCKKGQIVNYSDIKDDLGNVNLDFDTLDFDKKKRFDKHFKTGKIELPIVIKFGEKNYNLLSGNTRLAGLVKNKIKPKVWVINMSSINEEIKGGLSDNKSLNDIVKKHETKSNIESSIEKIKQQLNKGIKVEMEHTNNKKIAKEIAMDHLYEDPKYYDKLEKIENPKKQETKESTDSGSSGSFEASLSSPIKRKITTINNSKTTKESEIGEATDSSSSGQYDVPFGGYRKDPLKIDGEKSIKQSRAVKDPNFPKWGGPGGVFIKIKDKCKKFPYCNQGDINAIEILKESVTEISNKYGIPKEKINDLIIKEINKIFIINEDKRNK